MHTLTTNRASPKVLPCYTFTAMHSEIKKARATPPATVCTPALRCLQGWEQSSVLRELLN